MLKKIADLKKNRSFLVVLLMSMASCAGMQRSCASCTAEKFGADWIVVQYKMDGVPLNCWQMPSTSIDNEQGSDGIYWQSPDGHLVHISGHYNRVQVKGGDYAGAAEHIGVDLKRCKNGRYLPPETK